MAERLREELAQTMMNLERVTALVQTHLESVQVVEQQEVDGDQPQNVRQQEADSSHGGGGPRDPWAEFYQTASPDSVGNNDRTRFLKINSRFDKVPVLEGDRAAFKDWKAKVVEHIADGRQDVRELFAWAEKQQLTSITSEMEATAPSQGALDCKTASEAIYGALVKLTGVYWATKRELVPVGRGLEFWRVIHQEMEPRSREWQNANAQKVVAPTRAAAVQDLVGPMDVADGQLWA